MVCVIGLTPTVQRTLFFSDFQVGAVNRARRTLVTASGKAVNVARVLTTLKTPAILIHILGGDSGRYVERTLLAEEVVSQTVWHEEDAPTRTCTTLLSDTGATTELVEEARPVGIHDQRLLFASARTALLSARTLVCSGSLPPEVPDDFYARLIQEAHVFGIPTVVDAQKAPLRRALAERPYLVKPNLEEALGTLGIEPTGEREADASRAIAGLVDAGAIWALVSMGKAGSLLGNQNERYRIMPPLVDAINAIGSGDSLCAGFCAAHFKRGLSVPDAAVYGTACAAANTLTATSGVIVPSDVDRLLPEVRLERL